MYGAIYTFFTGRSPKWPALRRRHLEEWPCCCVCFSEVDLVVHHKRPVAWFPDEELNPENLLTMCPRCHLLIGHCNLYDSYNPDVDEDVMVWRHKIKFRPRREL